VLKEDDGDKRIMREIIEVPLPRAASSRLISFLTFQISIFFSASLACGALMMGRALLKVASRLAEGILPRASMILLERMERTMTKT
jgi:hypothetical protein